MTCKDCRFYLVHKRPIFLPGTIDGSIPGRVLDIKEGKCHAAPPTPKGFPSVREQDFCPKFEAKGAAA